MYHLFDPTSNEDAQWRHERSECYCRDIFFEGSFHSLEVDSESHGVTPAVILHSVNQKKRLGRKFDGNHLCEMTAT